MSKYEVIWRVLSCILTGVFELLRRRNNKPPQ